MRNTFATFIYFCLFIYLLSFIFLYYRKITKVLSGVLARVKARNSGSSPSASPGFDVSLSRLRT